jgi:hypothetical protein
MKEKKIVENIIEAFYTLVSHIICENVTYKHIE